MGRVPRGNGFWRPVSRSLQRLLRALKRAVIGGKGGLVVRLIPRFTNFRMRNMAENDYFEVLGLKLCESFARTPLPSFAASLSEAYEAFSAVPQRLWQVFLHPFLFPGSEKARMDQPGQRTPRSFVSDV